MQRALLKTMTGVALLGLVASLGQSTTALGNEAALRVGKQISNFTLRDFRGKEHSLSDYADSKAVVVIFLGTDCPLVKLYAPRIEQLSEEFASRGVKLIAINANRQDSPTEIGAFAQRNHLTFPILKDPDNAVADLFGAVRTPEAFVLDGKRVVRYWGRIDDQYGVGDGSGYARPKVERRDVAEAVNELLDGKEVSQPVIEATGCLIGRTQKVTPHGDVTYSKQVARVLQNRCVECHRTGEVAPFPLTNYEEVVGWADMIVEVVDAGRMPPWFADPKYGKFKNDCRMSDEEKEVIHTWVKNGCPEGDAKDLPHDKVFVDGWKIPKPDQVIYMSDEPYTVPAEGVVQYQFYEVDPGFKEDKWVKMAEARPGNPAVVHHIIAFIRPPGSGGGFGGGTQIGYAPGMPPRVFEKGQAIYIPAGSKFVFQMHYTPNGTEQEDRSYLGLIFADPKEVTKTVRGDATGNVSFTIPPGNGNYKVTSKKRFSKDTLLVSMLPHMHLRGKSFRFELEKPDGTREILLDVPKYDFNWQLWYNPVEPVLMPKGSRLHCTAYFDNSEDNPHNPDPTKEITWGEQTWEEMMFGFISTIDPNEDLAKAGGKPEFKIEDEKLPVAF